MCYIKHMQIIELATKLQSVGLSEKQARVYVAALFLGPSAVQKIAEQAEINRATTYVILDELASMGLVSESTEGKKTVFVAEPPQSIERYLDVQNKQISAKQDELKNILPRLKEVSRSSDGVDTPVVRFYKGKEGILQINSEMRRKAKPGTTIYGITNLDEVEKMFPGHFQVNHTHRLRKKLASKVLYFGIDQDLITSTKLMRQTKRLHDPVNADITFYQGSVNLIAYNGDNSTGIVIENKQIVETLRKLFELAWENYRSNDK